MYIPTGSELLKPEQILKKVNLKEGMVAADLGCGASGHFVFPSAKLVGEKGKVYAVDILKSVLSSIESRAKLQNFYNVEAIWSDIEVEGGTAVLAGSCDAVYLVNVHAKSEMIKEGLRLLKKGGKLLLIDWKTTATSAFGPASADRVSAEEVKKRVKEFNLNLEEEFDAGPHHWGLLYKK